MDYSILIQLFLLDIFFYIKVPWSSQNPTCPKSSEIHLFMNFRGKDTRHNFTSFLYDALFAAGMNVFLDEEGIGTGRQIDSEILEAINESMGAIIVFSKGYASSPWCLDELVLILERKRLLGSSYLLLPIYLDGVQPDDIFASFGKAMDKHNKWFWCARRKKVKAWRSALRQVGGYKGRILDGNWSKFINETVKDVREEFLAMGITIYPRKTQSTSRKYQPNSSSIIYALIKELLIMSIIISIPHFIAYKLPELRPSIDKLIYQSGHLLNVFLRSSFCQHLHRQFLHQPLAIGNVTSVEIWKEGSVGGWDWFGIVKRTVVLVGLCLMILRWLLVKRISPEVNLRYESYYRDMRQHSFILNKSRHDKW